MKKGIERMVEVAEKLEWGVTVEDKYILFRKYSPAGQDYTIEIETDSLKDVVKDLGKRCDNFDCSTETYYWLDQFGHGVNGAPYDMMDVYADMNACLEMMEELHDELKELEEKIDEMIDELSGDIPASEEDVREGWEKGSILFFDTPQDLKLYMQEREDKSANIDIYQMNGNRMAVDTSLLGRR